MTNTLNFTIAGLARLPIPPKSKRGYYKDSQVKGLYFAIHSSGSKSFYVVKKIAGRTEKIFLGKYPDLTIENARKHARIKLGQIADGINPQEEKRGIRREMTLKQLFDLYMLRYSKPHKKSWKHDEVEINRFLSHWFKCKLSDIKRTEIQRLHETIYHENGLYQANKILQRIRAIFNKGIEWGWQGINPTNGIKKYREKTRDRFIQPAELPFILTSIEAEKNETAKDFFTMLFLTGARKTNTAMMGWEQINWQSCEWRIPDTKNGDPVTIALTERAIDILLKRKQSSRSDLVFPRENDNKKLFAKTQYIWKRIKARATVQLWQQDEKIASWLQQLNNALPGYYTGNDAFKRITKQAEKEKLQLPVGVMDIRIHDIRRTFGSYQAISGTSLQIIGKSLGHKSAQATEIYARLNLDPVRASIEAATNLMFQLQSA